MVSNTTSTKDSTKAPPVSQEFQSHYLQRVTQELSDDLEKVRTADDFKADSVPFLIEALQQGAFQFSEADQKKVLESIAQPESGK